MDAKEQALQELAVCQKVDNTDSEVAHSRADDALCELLTSLGQADVVAEYRKVRHWCA